jgi:GT2 family glycosyltransferase
MPVLSVLALARDDRALPRRVVDAWSGSPAPAEAARLLDRALATGADHVVTSVTDGPVDPVARAERVATILEAVGRPLGAAHAGLLLGAADRPRRFGLVRPTWMHSAPLDPVRTVRTWRLSLGSCVLEADALRRAGGLDPAFTTLSGAGLDLGMRLWRNGEHVAHVPDLAEGVPMDDAPSVADEYRFLARHVLRWQVLLAAATSGRPDRAGWSVVRHGGRVPGAPPWTPTPRRHPRIDAGEVTGTVSVLVPTLDRRPYLRRVLQDLAAQTVPPHEVVVVDQSTPPLTRDELDWDDRIAPLVLLRQDVPGQSSARNRGLAAMTGTHVLFLDDDDEFGAELIEAHLRLLGTGQVDASCGMVEEAGHPPPAELAVEQHASGFPTNNTMARVAAVRAVGGFDLAFDRGARADHDLGMRLVRSGAVLWQNPDASLVHLRVPAGGLRTHGARKVTRSSSRSTLTARNLLTPTEAYLHRRYFGPEARRAAFRIQLLTVLRGEGSPGRRLARAVVQVVLLPDTIRRIRAAERGGDLLLERHPTLGRFDAPEGDACGS